MKRKMSNLMVQTTDGEAVKYPWATDVRQDRKGNLRIYHGNRERAFYPQGEWAAYVVSAVKPELEPSIALTEGTGN